MYDMKEFLLAIDGAFSRVIPKDEAEHLTIDNVTVVKINDEKLYGVSIRETGKDAAPTFYVNQWLEDWNNGYITSRDIAEQIYSIYRDSVYSLPAKAVNPDFRFEAVKDQLCVRVLDAERNKEYLQDKPHKVMESGLSVCYYIDVSNSYAVAVNEDVFGQMGVDLETLHEAAVENSVLLDPPILTDMQSAFFSPERVNLLEEEVTISPQERGAMYVLTSESGSFGASKLANPEIMGKAAAVIGESVYVLPSSLHEVILVPESSGAKVDELHRMVKEANTTVVKPRDILSDNVYHYNLVERKFECMTLEEVSVDEDEEFDM